MQCLAHSVEAGEGRELWEQEAGRKVGGGAGGEEMVRDEEDG